MDILGNESAGVIVTAIPEAAQTMAGDWLQLLDLWRYPAAFNVITYPSAPIYGPDSLLYPGQTSPFWAPLIRLGVSTNNLGLLNNPIYYPVGPLYPVGPNASDLMNVYNHNLEFERILYWRSDLYNGLWRPWWQL